MPEDDLAIIPDGKLRTYRPCGTPMKGTLDGTAIKETLRRGSRNVTFETYVPDEAEDTDEPIPPGAPGFPQSMWERGLLNRAEMAVGDAMYEDWSMYENQTGARAGGEGRRKGLEQAGGLSATTARY